MNSEISYMNTERKLDLSIAPSGIATLAIGTNRNAPDIEVVGLFRHMLEARDVAELVAALNSSEFRNAENPVSAVPGEHVRRLSIKEEGDAELMKWAAFHSPPGPAFLAAEARAMRVVGLVRQYPAHAIAMEASGLPDRVKRESPMEFSMTIVNAGSEIVQLLHPEKWSDGGVQLELVGSRSDIPEEELEEFHQKFEELSKDQVRDIQGGEADGPFITLGSGGRLVFLFEISLDWPPGRYDVNLSLMWPLANEDGVEQIVCELISRTLPLDVFGKSKAGDEADDLDEEEDFDEEELDEDDLDETDLEDQ